MLSERGQTQGEPIVWFCLYDSGKSKTSGMENRWVIARDWMWRKGLMFPIFINSLCLPAFWLFAIPKSIWWNIIIILIAMSLIILRIFSSAYLPFVYIFVDDSLQIPHHHHFYYWVLRFLSYFGLKSFIRYVSCKYFSFHFLNIVMEQFLILVEYNFV